jgi:glycosyltransferase involved in cell wall biosynthesis
VVKRNFCRNRFFIPTIVAMPPPIRPRVLLHAFSTFKLGGPQARFVQLANAFGPQYHHVVAAMDNCFDAGERLGPQVSWQPLPLLVKKGGTLTNRAAFRQVLKAQRPDLLLSYNWGAIEWAAANWPQVVPHVHVEDGFGPEEATRQLPRRVWMRRALLGWCGVPVVVASRQLERIATQVWKLPANKVQFIPNGVAIDPCYIEKRRLALIDKGQLTIGTVAGLRPEKNIARLIKAFAAVRAQQAARLIVVGSGPELPALQQLAASLGVADDVEFTGYLADPISRLIEFDLFALSSDTEQLPIAMLEAMACGIPVVATRVGDVTQIMPSVSQDALAAVNDSSFSATLIRAVEKRFAWNIWATAGQTIATTHYSLASMQYHWQLAFDNHFDEIHRSMAAQECKPKTQS